ncbi:MAG TPA: hypothetical protein VEA99_02125 [Gemmatimonadaceae bacterium]|nr:hypothetical protein [Gemmatimonadaceae bacterium]
MRTPATLLALSLVALAACSDDAQRRSALPADLQQDLKLATTSVALPETRANENFALETAPVSAPAPATTLRRAPGRRAVRSPAPTVAAAPEPMPAASEETTLEVSQTPAAATETADAEPVSDGVALPRPTAIPVSLPAEGSGREAGSADGGRRGGGIFGPVIGVVIRGGGVDGDNCEIHDRRGRRRPVYDRNPGGIAGGRRPTAGGGWGGPSGTIGQGLPRY